MSRSFRKKFALVLVGLLFCLAFLAGYSQWPASSHDLISLFLAGFCGLLPAATVARRADKAIENLSYEEVWQRTTQEVDELVAWYHAQISRSEAESIGAAYARYSSRYQESVVDQLRRILEHAIKMRVYVPREFVFFDIRVTARKRRRYGLVELDKVMRAKKVQTLLLFATNRLHRKTYRTLEFADVVCKSWRIRIMFVAQGIDTHDTKQWDLLLAFHAMMDQFTISLYADNIRAAHEGLFERRMVFGSLSYGYCGIVIEGEYSPRGKPRRRLAIDPETARIVRLIFHLFVHEHKKLKQIPRILNDDPSIPLPDRCRSGHWTDDLVRRILTNTRYRGCWKYGVTESVYLAEKDYIGKHVRLEPLKEAQIEPLRIVSDEEWYAAAKLIAKHGNGGRPPKDGDQTLRPKVLNGLLYCAGHDRPLVVSGAHGRHMVCPVCQVMPASKRRLTSWLNRAEALRQTCQEISQLMLADEGLVEQAIDECRWAAKADGRPAPERIEKLKAARNTLQRRIDFSLRNVGETAEEQSETERVLRELRSEKGQVEAELSLAEAAQNRKFEVPTARRVRDLLKNLGKLLTDASISEDPADRAAARQLIEELTGGRIVVSQKGSRQRQRGWLRGTFRLQLLNTVVRRITNGAVNCDADGEEVSIDFKRPLKTDTKAEVAWTMHHDKKRHAEIAAALGGCCTSYVTKLLKHYAQTHGLKWIDGRSLRVDFPHINRQPALFKRIVDEVMKLYFDDVPMGEIALQLEVHVVTVRNARNWYFEQRGEPIPNGRARAGRLRRKRRRGKDAA